MYQNHPFAVAPMMDWTDTHCRFFHRLMSKRALLYTEMVTTGALIHGDKARHLDYNASEHPLSLQLGGSNPKDLALCAKIGEDWGYDEINLNCGCPSDRVQNGAFGACLMAEPDLVAECIASMKQAVKIPITVKCRIGIDDQNEEEALFTFAQKQVAAGVDALIVHARKAWLQGLSPKQNRDIPPLNYALVMALKKTHPSLNITINGGIESHESALELIAQGLDGVMLGRAAYHSPALMLEVDKRYYGHENPLNSPDEALELLIPYVETQLKTGSRISHITKHILGLYQSVPNARAFRRHLSENACKENAGIEVLVEALRLIQIGREKLIA